MSVPGGIHERVAAFTSELSTLHDLTDRLSRTNSLTDALHETLRAGATLLGAQRGLLNLRPSDGLGPHRVVGLGLSHAELGHLDTVPPHDAPHTRLLRDDAAGRELVHPDIARDEALHPRHREVAAHLGCGASYAVPLTNPPTAGQGQEVGESAGPLGVAVWLYDHPGAPEPRSRHLLARYLRQATAHLSQRVELDRARSAARALRDGLLPRHLPQVPGVTLAVHHAPARPRAGAAAVTDAVTDGGTGGFADTGTASCTFYDALPLPEGALGLAIGTTTGSGPTAGPATLAAAGGLRAGLRAYAVMEGEDPVAVLSDLELLLRMTEPHHVATALFAYAEPPPSHGPAATRRVVVASAGQPPPLVVGPTRVVFADTALSAPLGMLPCWEAPSVRLDIAHGETVLLYNLGLLRATRAPLDQAYTRLEEAARAAPPRVRADPAALTRHLARALLPDDRHVPGLPEPTDAAHGHPAGRRATHRGVGLVEDAVLLAARFQGPASP
ncbi:SpoIIE family protein phosphatase [Streptomyces sp. 4N509B]|uniref:SpoIIE family protein phosphatase n=1 Tax=Streptomyces sp. 4N509B TaxID=3457413 RepID=UPI003FD51898